MNPKSGFLTSEFWGTALTVASNASVAFGILNQEEADNFTKAIVAAAGGVTTAIVVAMYTYSRIRVKVGK